MAKPTYLGLLNALAVAESAAEHYLLAWADTTKDTKLATSLKFVAIREGEHGKAFAKRMLELGFEVRKPVADHGKASMEIASSAMSDLEKFEALHAGRPVGETDVFDTMFMDKTIDPQTGGLLGRYIAEERDSGRLLNAEYERLAAKAAKSPKSKAAAKGKGKAGAKAKTSTKAKAQAAA